MSADLRAVLDGKRTDGKRLSAHIAETAAAPWLDPLGKPYLFESVDECNRSWRSLMEHEAIEVEALEAALLTALERLAAAIEENERLGAEVEQWRAEHQDATAPTVRPMTKVENGMMDMQRDFGFDVGFWRRWAIRLEPRLSFLAERQHLTNDDADAAERLLAALAQEKPHAD